MKTAHTKEQIKWHLTNNVLPTLDKTTIEKIIKTIDKFNKGKITLDSQIAKGANCTVGEMFDDLQIELRCSGECENCENCNS